MFEGIVPVLVRLVVAPLAGAKLPQQEVFKMPGACALPVRRTRAHKPFEKGHTSFLGSRLKCYRGLAGTLIQDHTSSVTSRRLADDGQVAGLLLRPALVAKGIGPLTQAYCLDSFRSPMPWFLSR